MARLRGTSSNGQTDAPGPGDGIAPNAGHAPTTARGRAEPDARDGRVGSNGAGVTRRSTNHPSSKRVALDEAHQTFRKWFGDDYDLDFLNAILAAVASDKLDGDPAWLMGLGGSGTAKTATLATMEGPSAHLISTIHSTGALLSATSPTGAKPKKKPATQKKIGTGGLLQKIGDSGVILIKDVTTILSMDRTSRSEVLAALREIYDGRWIRNVGSEGGQTLEWQGRITVVGACTTAWDRYYSVISTMGDRFILFRLKSTDNAARLQMGRQSMANVGKEGEMFGEMQKAVRRVLGGVQRRMDIQVSEASEEAVLQATNIATLARSAVDFDQLSRISHVYEPEAPTRLTKQLVQLMRGALAIGLSEREALDLALRCARDCIPPERMQIMKDLAKNGSSTTTEISKRIQQSRSYVSRAVQALYCHGLLKRDMPDGSEREFYRLADGVSMKALGAGG